MPWQWRKLERGTSLEDVIRHLNRRMLSLTHTLNGVEARQSGVTTLSAGDATPSADGAAVLVTANTGATTITAIDDGKPGWSLVIVFGDSDTTIQHGANLQLIGYTDFTGAAGDVLRFVTDDGTTWREAPQPHRWS